jgi:nucleoside 2-deoxyribosyltransferase
MKFFVSGKVGYENDARELMDLLRQAGHEITFDWTTIAHLRPYDQNTKASREAALLESRGVKEADILIIVAHDAGAGMFVELGIAIGAGIPVRVITGKESPTMFFYHPLVKRVTDVNDIIKEFSQ